MGRVYFTDVCVLGQTDNEQVSHAADCRKDMKIIHKSNLKNLEFTFASGDLFDAAVEAIVNSEQTDFILSKNPKSVSGQIWARYGDRNRERSSLASLFSGSSGILVTGESTMHSATMPAGRRKPTSSARMPLAGSTTVGRLTTRASRQPSTTTTVTALLRM